MGHLERMWVNQSSALQPFHKLHGTHVLAGEVEGSHNVRVYFLSGDVICQIMPRIALSKGWPEAKLEHPKEEK